MAGRRKGGDHEQSALNAPAGREYLAAVRYRDGSSELVRIRRAEGIDDARQVALDTLMNIATLVLAEAAPAMD